MRSKLNVSLCQVQLSNYIDIYFDSTCAAEIEDGVAKFVLDIVPVCAAPNFPESRTTKVRRVRIERSNNGWHYHIVKSQGMSSVRVEMPCA